MSSPCEPLLPLWWALDSALLPLPSMSLRIPPLKVIVIESIDDTLCPLPVPWVNAAPGDVFWTLWRTKETSCEEHSTLWDDGIGPRRSQCLYLTGHLQSKRGAL